jgi:hypothetical protein
MHSIPDIKNLCLTPVRHRNVIESDACEGGGVQNSPETEKNNNIEKPPVTVRTEK